MDNNYGAYIERGVIDAEAQNGYKVKSLSREGIITPALPALNGTIYHVGDYVYFFVFDDGHGAILAAIQ